MNLEPYFMVGGLMKPKTNYMPPEEFEKLRRYILGTVKVRGFKAYDIVMLFNLCYECGLRINEALRLDVKDFDFDNHEIDLGTTKTHENDSCSIPPEFSKELKMYIDKKQGRIWKLSRQAVYQWLKKWGEYLNIPSLTTPQTETHEKTVSHIFRKSKGKDMLYADAPLNIVMTKLRHNDLQTTTKYLKLKLADVKAWEAQHG